MVDTRQVTKLKRRAKWTSSLVYSTIITLLVSVVLGVGGVLYVAYNNQKWCKVITTFTDSWAESPPSTKSGKDLAANMQDLKGDLGCE
jgi:hypothetical protein